MTEHDADLRMTLSPSRQADAANSYARSGILRIVDLYAADVAETLNHHLDLHRIRCAPAARETGARY